MHKNKFFKKHWSQDFNALKGVVNKDIFDNVICEQRPEYK